MRHRRFVHAVISAACSLFALILYAGPKDFWEAKPYTDWSAKEVEKLLRKDSPWTRTLLENAPATAVNIGGTESPTKGGGTGDLGGAGGGGSKGGAGRGSSGGGAAAPAPGEVFITWNSRPIREALARQMMLTNPSVTQQQLDQIVNYKPQFFEFLVMGLPLGRGRDAEAQLAKFKTDTCLQKKNQEKIPLANIVTPRAPNQPTTLQFAREVDGKPTLTAEDQEVTLVIRIGEHVYKYKFKFADMMVKGQLEI
jgi:hypothetical protein